MVAISSSIDSGRRSLMGFVYQCLIGVGAQVFFGQPNQGALANGDIDVDGGIEFDQNSDISIFHERFGEDLNFEYSAEGGILNQTVLVQAKYSMIGTSLGESAVIDIFNHFNGSVQRARELGNNVPACLIVTNRELGFSRDRFLELADGFDFQVGYKNITMLNLENRLEEFFKKFGLTARETETGTSLLLGRLISNTSNPSFRITKDIFFQAFTGNTNPRQISLSALKNELGNKQEEFGSFLGADYWEGLFIEREAMRDLEKKIYENSLICITGSGGSGKSVLAWQLLKQALEENRALIDMNNCDRTDSNWIQKMVSVWRFHGNSMADTDIDTSLKRILLANDALSSPILWLALDGLDEGRIDRTEIPHLLDWFYQAQNRKMSSGTPNLASIIITCREEQELLDLVRGRIQKEKFEFIDLDNFTAKEKTQGFRKAFPDRVKQLGIESAAWTQAGNFPVFEDSKGSDQIICDEEVLVLLDDPLLWKTLLELEEAEKKAILDGDMDYSEIFTEGLLDWFYSKFSVRKNAVSNIIALDILRNNLIGLAEATENGPITNQTWLDFIGVDIGPVFAKDLFSEAKTAGIIKAEDAGSWNWRHAFMPRGFALMGEEAQ